MNLAYPLAYFNKLLLFIYLYSTMKITRKKTGHMYISSNQMKSLEYHWTVEWNYCFTSRKTETRSPFSPSKKYLRNSCKQLHKWMKHFNVNKWNIYIRHSRGNRKILRILFANFHIPKNFPLPQRWKLIKLSFENITFGETKKSKYTAFLFDCNFGTYLKGY